MKILFIGDIVGRPGRKALENRLCLIEQEYNIDFTIANGENVTGGFGIDSKKYDELRAHGIDAFTLGNHAFDNRGIYDIINDPNYNIVRPANFEDNAKGVGYRVYNLKNGKKLATINIVGKVFNNSSYDCPFKAVDKILKEISLDECAILVDFHADATSEKQALGWYLDGRVSVVVGTHTHTQTADEKVLPRGTGYISDVGMTGGYDSVLGMSVESAVSRFVSTDNIRFTPADGPKQINAVVIDINDKNKTSSIERIFKIVE